MSRFGTWVAGALRAVVILRVYQVLTIAALAIIFGWLVFDGLQDSDRQSRESDARIAAVANYSTALDVYRTQLEQRDTCLSSVETRQAYRQRFIASAETKDGLITVIAERAGLPETDEDVVRLRSLVAAELEAIDRDLPPRDPADCPSAPTPPTPPELEAPPTTEEP